MIITVHAECLRTHLMPRRHSSAYLWWHRPSWPGSPVSKSRFSTAYADVHNGHHSILSMKKEEYNTVMNTEHLPDQRARPGTPMQPQFESPVASPTLRTQLEYIPALASLPSETREICGAWTIPSTFQIPETSHYVLCPYSPVCAMSLCNSGSAISGDAHCSQCYTSHQPVT